MKHKRLLVISAVLALIHLGSVLYTAYFIHNATGPEAIEMWMLYWYLDMPVSMLGAPLEHLSNSSMFYPIYFGVVGSLQWLLVVYLCGRLIGVIMNMRWRA